MTMIISCSNTWHVPTSLSLHTLSIDVSTRVSSIIQNQTRAFRDAAPQTTQEHAEEQPATTTAAESAEERPAPVRFQASTPVGDDESARMPPPSSVVEEEERAPTTPPSDGRRTPTAPRAEASSPKGSPSRVQGPVKPVTAARGSAEGEETQATFDDEVEEIQGRPHDGRQHVYVWRQRGDRFIGHEELAETEVAARVERAAKRLVKVSGLVLCSRCVCALTLMRNSFMAQ